MEDVRRKVRATTRCDSKSSWTRLRHLRRAGKRSRLPERTRWRLCRSVRPVHVATQTAIGNRVLVNVVPRLSTDCTARRRAAGSKMMKHIFVALACVWLLSAHAQEDAGEVLVLGVFHFAN